MGERKLPVFYLASVLGVILASAYPLYMGVSVLTDMLRFGTVYAENYPKYIIPYTPLSLAVLVGVALLPLAVKYAGKPAYFADAGAAVACFFAAELLLERTVTVTRTVTGTFSTLEDWQMYMCYIPPDAYEERTWTEVNVLMGEYTPAFKMHFYIISLVLILSILRCFYGFSDVLSSGNRKCLLPLVSQSAATLAFLGMCVWACFTAFYRTGEIRVSPLSAVLMGAFFLLFGVTAGLYAASFTRRRKKRLSVLLPAAVDAAVTLLMYIGEMILLSGHLYRFGSGFFFDGIRGIVLAPADIVLILLSGGVTAALASLLRDKTPDAEDIA